MTKLDLIKKKIELLKGRMIKIKVNEGRNKFVYYNGYIDNLYPSIFTIKTILYGEERTISFSYVNVLSKMVKFYPLDKEDSNCKLS